MSVPFFYILFAFFKEWNVFESLNSSLFYEKLMWKTGWQRQKRWLVYFYATVELVHYTHYVDKGVLMAGVANTYRARICEPLRSPGIDSQLGELVRQLYLSHRPARIHRLAESIPGLHKGLQIRALHMFYSTVHSAYTTVQLSTCNIHVLWIHTCNVQHVYKIKRKKIIAKKFINLIGPHVQYNVWQCRTDKIII
jgi:hypothetical protein